MTSGNWNQCGWVWSVLRAAALAAVLGVSGCANTHRYDLDAPPVGMPQDDTEAFDNNGPAKQINMFGEVDGTGHSQGQPVGDQGFQQHTCADEGYDADVTVSPTGRWIAFASTRHNVHAGIYLQRVDGTAVTKLTADDSDNAFPCFSPDGKQIAFCSTRSGTWNIYTMDTEGRNSVQVTNGDIQCVHPSFSPDGTRLVYSALGSRSNQWELWTVDLGTGEKRQIGYGLFPSWSPDKSGDKIAFQRARQRGSRWFSLWTLDLVDGEARHVTEVAVSSNSAIVSPNWSPDGKRLVFATIVDPSHAGSGRKGEQDLWTINCDGTDRRRLTDGNGMNLSPVWAAGNRVFFVSDRSGTESVWSVRPDVSAVQAASATPNAATANPAVPEAKPQAVGSVDTRDAEH